MTLTDFAEVCMANHSTMDHVRRMPLETLGLDRESGVSKWQRAEAFARWLWEKRNDNGESVLDLLEFVMDSGSPKDLSHRVFEATRLKGRKLPHFGVNQVAELTGWARPDLCPPRKGRTSKGLRALGFDVRVY